jgi:predicted ATP-dependent endonuclease of OLD family
MKIVAFSVQNYRSITKANKLPISNSTILIGPNNEGKSNILRALVTTLRLLKSFRILSPLKPGGRSVQYVMHRDRTSYDWEIDFPISLQQSSQNGGSIFTLELELDPSEISDFKAKVGSSLNGTLPIQITWDKDRPILKIRKKGRGAAALTKKVPQIAQFISGKLDYVYIPAVRTAKSAQTVVEDILSDELEIVEEKEEFKKALQEIARIQQPVLDQISKSIGTTLREFLPNVKEVRVIISEEERYKALRHSCQITINDGTPTRIQQKGDGVQSLAALSLMKHASERSASGKNLILAIEEPESHLHPKAIHQLKQVISDISTRSQVILTTHCPTFVDRLNLQSNIVVSDNKAIPARNIEIIRDILGVKASDNLRHAELVLVVEGEDDKIALNSMLACASQQIKIAVTQGMVAIDSLLGGSNLSYKLTQLRDAICNYHCFLDDDDCGRKSYQKAEQDNLLTQADINFTVCDGMSEAEIEDLYDSSKYADMIKNGYGVLLDTPKFHSSKKWSVRMEEVFRQQGKLWNDSVKKQIKEKIAEIASLDPTAILNTHKRSSFDSLVLALENKLEKLSFIKKHLKSIPLKAENCPYKNIGDPDGSPTKKPTLT